VLGSIQRPPEAELHVIEPEERYAPLRHCSPAPSRTRSRDRKAAAPD
jgi:hypothetical protein